MRVREAGRGMGTPLGNSTDRSGVSIVSIECVVVGQTVFKE